MLGVLLMRLSAVLVVPCAWVPSSVAMGTAVSVWLCSAAPSPPARGASEERREARLFEPGGLPVWPVCLGRFAGLRDADAHGLGWGACKFEDPVVKGLRAADSPF